MVFATAPPRRRDRGGTRSGGHEPRDPQVARQRPRREAVQRDDRAVAQIRRPCSRATRRSSSSSRPRSTSRTRRTSRSRRSWPWRWATARSARRSTPCSRAFATCSARRSPSGAGQSIRPTAPDRARQPPAAARASPRRQAVAVVGACGRPRGSARGSRGRGDAYLPTAGSPPDVRRLRLLVRGVSGVRHRRGQGQRDDDGHREGQRVGCRDLPHVRQAYQHFEGYGTGAPRARSTRGLTGSALRCGWGAPSAMAWRGWGNWRETCAACAAIARVAAREGPSPPVV